MSEQSEVLSYLRRIENLLTILVKSQLSDVIAHELSSEKMKRLYDLTGDCDVRSLAKKINSSAASISRIWQRWEKLGLIVKDGRTYRKIL